MATFWIFLSTAVRKGKFRRQEWNSFSTCLLFLETSVIRLPSRVDFTVSKSPGSENERGPEFQVAMRASFLATTVTTTSRSYGKHYTRRCSLIQEACVSHPWYTLWWEIEFDNDIRKRSYHTTTPYTADLLLDASKCISLDGERKRFRTTTVSRFGMMSVQRIRTCRNCWLLYVWRYDNTRKSEHSATQAAPQSKTDEHIRF